MIQRPIHAIVTDIEGTTSAIDFVHRVLFPYARDHLPAFVRQNAAQPEVREPLQATAELAAMPDAGDDQLIEQLLQWIDEDRKATPLKALQGLIWRQGYEQGVFTGHLYPEVAAELERWQRLGIALYVYSSGSIKAQQLLFGYSNAGDLTPLFQGYFDTTTGPKRAVESYLAITRQLDLPPGQILFLSDVVEELDAAREAGLQTAQLVRMDNMTTSDHPTFNNFSEISEFLLPSTPEELTP